MPHANSSHNNLNPCLEITKKKITVTVTSIKNNCRKLEKEVGMAMPKSIQTRVVGMITNTTGIPTLHTHAHWYHTAQSYPICGATVSIYVRTCV